MNSKYSYFSMVPYLIDDLQLTPSAYRLYGHLKRVAGESGECWQTQQTLMKSCNMSNRTIVRSKRELEKAGLIKIDFTCFGGRTGHLIKLTDLWAVNDQTYKKRDLN